MVNSIYYYVYYSYEEWGRGYIGRRECNCLPEEDVKYLGSFKDKTFKPTQKIILQVFDTLQEAIEAEIILHSFYKVNINPHFANKARAIASGFYFKAFGKNHPMFGKGAFLGRTHSDKTKKKLSEIRRGENNPMFGKLGTMQGKTHSEESRKKMSEAKRGKTLSEEHKKKLSEAHRGRKGSASPFYGRHWFTNGVKDTLSFECPPGFKPGRLSFSRKSHCG
jgi:hypothetical protein